MNKLTVAAIGMAVLWAVGIFVAWQFFSPVDNGGSRRRDVSGPPPAAGDGVDRQAGSSNVADPDWVATTAAKYAIPQRALQAYAAAEIAQRKANPECNLVWNTLAGIGSVESAHGTIGGAALDAEGRPDKPIIGPPLNGENGTRAIRATGESTRFHGDEEWDRAIGPFQFLTSSWQRYGIDADGDGVADPRDIDDAALGAARHLCTSGYDLSGNDWGRAVFGYNNSSAYVDRVRDIAASYAR